MRRRPRSLGALLGLVALSALLGGCGVPADSVAHPISQSRIPASLEKPAKTPSASHAVSGDKKVQIYLVFENRLAPVDRYVTVDPIASEVNEALDALNNGPDATEFEHGYQTALTQTSEEQVRLKSIDTKKAIATVELGSVFDSAQLQGTHLYEAFAQIVYTVTGFGFSRVNFVLDGATFPAYLPNGTFSNGPVGRTDYEVISPLTLS